MKLLRTAALFATVWLMLGFAAGTIVLLGPVRWVTETARARDLSPKTENLLVILIIVLYVAATAAASALLARYERRARSRSVTAVLLVLVTLPAAAALWLWMHPALLVNIQNIPDAPKEQFTFGPYPATDSDLQLLKQRGYTAVISLLHPAVVPFEPQLIAEEKERTEKVKLPLIHVPMLPWVSQNQEALDTLGRLMLDTQARYYVHCYLGKDRIRVVRRFIESHGFKSKLATPEQHRLLTDGLAWERGQVVQLDEGLFLTPYPTDEEYFGYVLAGSVQHVVSLLDVKNPENEPWIQKEQALAKTYSLSWSSIPLSLSPFDPAQAIEAAQKVRPMARLTVVHAFRDDSPEAAAFRIAYQTGLPPLPPPLFREPLRGGNVELLGPNIAAGPSPTAPEFDSYLYQKGVRALLFCGPDPGGQTEEDRRLAQKAGLSWQAASPRDESLEKTLEQSLTFYLYGPEIEAVRARIRPPKPPAPPAVSDPGE
ncbi:MAG: hypothetical protein HYU36_17470 [Planctomycetes bacterium]|nr:hypothetical protein [Planctomycetota bacterium]